MHFVIAGHIKCPQFSFAVMLAQRLRESLPDFTYLQISKTPMDWEKWLINICRENNWYHVQSPIIWREIGLKKGKKELIGNINRFLDICYDYYGVPREVLSAENFTKSEIEWFRQRTESQYFENIRLEAKSRIEYRARQVCITGASSPVAEIVIMELLQLEQQNREKGLEIRLFDEPRKEAKLISTMNDTKYCPAISGFGNCRVAKSLKEALLNVDLVIVLDAFSRKPKESLVQWLKRNRNAMCALGKGLNMYAKVHCRVVIGSPSNQPICYNANVLASFATKLHVRNIVVVTQDMGREMLKSLSIKSEVHLRDLYCPPVWGFIGLNKFIDVRKTLQTNIYKVPGKRPHSNLPQGTEELELRTIDCLIGEDDLGELYVKVANHKMESFHQLGRWPGLAKATAIVDLLKLWGLKQEDGNGEIISLGVYSDGTFGIPQGLYWSQPVILKKGFWVPFPDYPVPRSYHFSCYSLFLCGLAVLYRTKVKPRRYVPPNTSKNVRKKKFDFDEITKGVSMPVIRTDRRCVNYLKTLAKTELGIDFDSVDSTIKEEPESGVLNTPETIPREKLYCECWRDELKELQKVIFYRSSSTEREVDLSDNLSGSEWSIVNTSAPPPPVQAPEKVSSTKTSNKIIDVQGSLNKHSSSTITICSCGALSNGSICRCLEKTPSCEDENFSTTQYYKEQNAEIFQEESKDVIYEDTYTKNKAVKFDPEAEQEDKTSHLPDKFYGKKDAIRDELADSRMKERIRKYEQGSKESLIEERSETNEKTRNETSAARTSKHKSVDAKFHISFKGTFYEIVGDQEGLKSLEVQKNTENSSVKSFRDMYADGMGPPVGMVPAPAEISETSSEIYAPFSGENNLELKNVYGELPEAAGENLSYSSLDEALDALYDKELYGEDKDEEILLSEDYTDEKSKTKSDKEKGKKEEKTKWKKEGVSVCCLCRCLLPEGLACCPCGSTTVVEVFKKESMEIFVQSEDDFSYKVEYMERFLPPTPSTISDVEPVPEEEIKFEEKALPPESFFPFSPKLPNEFVEEVRPQKYTKEYIDSLKPKMEQELPKKCVELFNMAKMKLEEEGSTGETEINESNKELFQKTCRTKELPVKSDFSDLHLFIPEGVEDWRLTVQMKYGQFFYQGPKVRDEAYYDFAIEEISEDECEMDEELEAYFET